MQGECDYICNAEHKHGVGRTHRGEAVYAHRAVEADGPGLCIVHGERKCLGKTLSECLDFAQVWSCFGI